jgi:hypothetical protein
MSTNGGQGAETPPGQVSREGRRGQLRVLAARTFRRLADHLDPPVPWRSYHNANTTSGAASGTYRLTFLR